MSERAATISISGEAQAASGPNVAGQIQAFAARIGADRRRQDTGDGGKRAVKPELAQDGEAGDGVLRNGADRRRQANRGGGRNHSPRNRLQASLPQLKIKARYYEMIAEAFRLGLENKIDVAKQTLEGCIQEVQSIRGSNGRNVYINQAGPTSLGRRRRFLWHRQHFYISAGFRLSKPGRHRRTC